MSDMTNNTTAHTPEQMRALAESYKVEVIDATAWEMAARAALRAAADQLEAVRAWLDGQDSAEWESVDLGALDTILTADSASREAFDG